MASIPTSLSPTDGVRHDAPLTVAALQLDIVKGDRQANLNMVVEAVAQLEPKPDVVVLPELFTTGCVNDPTSARSLAESVNGATMQALKELAARERVAVCGSFLASEGDGLFNRAFFVEPSGDTTWYDKRHLFAFGGEDRTFSAGTRRVPVVRFRGWNIAMAVCYDLRFPVWLRSVDNAYDLLVVMANWPDSRAFAWSHLLIARAIENQAYVVGCNRSGTDTYGQYGGTSSIINAKGAEVGKLTVTPSGVPCFVATLSRTELYDFRKKFPVYLDADRFSIEG